MLAWNCRNLKKWSTLYGEASLLSTKKTFFDAKIDTGSHLQQRLQTASWAGFYFTLKKGYARVGFASIASHLERWFYAAGLQVSPNEMSRMV